MTEPQTWTLIGAFAASSFALVGLVSTTFLRVLRAEIGSVRAEIGGLRAELLSEIRMLARDVSAIARRVFPEEP